MIKAITPSDNINRAIWRWIHGATTWNLVGIMIMEEVANGTLHPDTRTDVIKRVAHETYHGK